MPDFCLHLVLLLLLLLLSRFSCVWLCATPETAAHQASPSLGFSRQGHWSGLPFPSPMHESEKRKVKVKSLSRSRLLATPWTAAYQAPLSMDFPGKSTGVGCHCLVLLVYLKCRPIEISSWGFTGLSHRRWITGIGSENLHMSHVCVTFKLYDFGHFTTLPMIVTIWEEAFIVHWLWTGNWT